jgi:hypothetical protein
MPRFVEVGQVGEVSVLERRHGVLVHLRRVRAQDQQCDREPVELDRAMLAARVAILVLLLPAVLLATGCGSSRSHGKSFQPRFAADRFSGATVDNAWFPLKPGTTFVYRGTKNGRASRDTVTVLRTTREIRGVACRVVHDRVFVNGALAEDTFDWYAQDKAANVWYFGEATKELERGKVTSREGSWEAGRNGAKPGIVMQAHPRVGVSYEQEHYKGQAEDHAKVLSLSASVAVPYGSYGHAQLTKEWTPLEPNVVDHKYYVRGIGLVKEASARGPHESAVLVRVTRRNI